MYCDFRPRPTMGKNKKRDGEKIKKVKKRKENGK